MRGRLVKVVSIVGSILFGLFLAASGVDPDGALANLVKWRSLLLAITIPVGLIEDLIDAAKVLMIFTGGITVMAFYTWFRNYRQFRRANSAARLVSSLKSLPVSEFYLPDPAPPVFVSMREAATRCYETLRKTDAAAAPDELSEGSPLDWCATFLSIRGLPVYGAHAPARHRELVADNELRRLSFEKEATELHELFSRRNPVYNDLAVRENELSAALEAIKRDYSKGISWTAGGSAASPSDQ